MAPKVLDWVQLWRVRREVLCLKPTPLGSQEVLDNGTAMRREAVPQQDRLPIPDMVFQGTQVIEDLRLLNRTGMKSQTQLHVPRAGRCDQTRDRRHSFPVERHDQDESLATRRPGATDRRALRETALIQENQERTAILGLFLSAGHRCFSQ